MSTIVVTGAACGVFASTIVAAKGAFALQMVVAAVAAVASIYLGRRAITASSIFFLSIAVFVGIGGVWLEALGLQGGESASIGVAVCLLVGTTAAAGYSLQYRRRSEVNVASRPPPGPSHSIRRLVYLGAGLIVGSIGLARLDATGPTSSALAYLSVLTLVLVVAKRSSLMPRSLGNLVYAMLAIGAAGYYVAFVFHGFGRLLVAELALGCLILWSIFRPSTKYRWAISGGVALAIVLGAVAGTTRTSDLSVAEAWVESVSVGQITRGDAGGLGSLYAPLQNTVRLVEYRAEGVESLASLRLGRTYVGMLLVPIPRAVWADKPAQINREIVAVLSPELAATEHSDTVGMWGEAFLNFGMIGLIGIPILVALICLKADDWYHRRFGSRRSRDWDLAVLVYASTVSGIPDLVWGGAETFASRAGVRLMVLGLAFVVYRRFGLPNSGGQSDDPARSESAVGQESSNPSGV